MPSRVSRQRLRIFLARLLAGCAGYGLVRTAETTVYRSVRDYNAESVLCCCALFFPVVFFRSRVSSYCGSYPSIVPFG